MDVINIMDISVIIVSWNVKNRLKKNLAAIYKSEVGFDFEVFVVDNASKDGSADMVRSEFPQVKLIVNNENVGFAKANNQAIRMSSGRYILLLNPDMEVFPDTLGKMAGWMDNHKNTSVAGCRLLDENGKTIRHVRRFPAIWDQALIILKIPHLFPGVLNNYLRFDFDYDRQSKVDSIRGGFFMMRAEAVDKIGLLDERFFVWFEEVDYCKRVVQAGGEVWYTSEAQCIDYVGQSFKQLKRGRAQKLFRNSQIKYFKKWHPRWQALVLAVLWPIGGAMAVIGGFFGGGRGNNT